MGVYGCMCMGGHTSMGMVKSQKVETASSWAKRVLNDNPTINTRLPSDPVELSVNLLNQLLKIYKTAQINLQVLENKTQYRDFITSSEDYKIFEYSTAALKTVLFLLFPSSFSLLLFPSSFFLLLFPSSFSLPLFPFLFPFSFSLLLFPSPFPFLLFPSSFSLLLFPSSFSLPLFPFSFSLLLFPSSFSFPLPLFLPPSPFPFSFPLPLLLFLLLPPSPS